MSDLSHFCLQTEGDLCVICLIFKSVFVSLFKGKSNKNKEEQTSYLKLCKKRLFGDSST